MTRRIVFVTGGAGFIGSNIVARMAEDRDLDLVVCDRLRGVEAGKWRNIAKHPIGDFVEPEQMFDWLEKRWNTEPRDTRALQALLKFLPGGTKLARWSEAAPYLLTIVLVTHGAFFGHVDLMVLGGYGLATWLTERLSNEVAARTRETNTRIADRFARLADDQIERVVAWLDKRSPPPRVLDQLERTAQEASEMVS